MNQKKPISIVSRKRSAPLIPGFQRPNLSTSVADFIISNSSIGIGIGFSIGISFGIGISFSFSIGIGIISTISTISTISITSRISSIPSHHTLLKLRLSSRNRLRFIYQGRLLPDSSALSSVIKAPPPPPPPPPPPRHHPSSSPCGSGSPSRSKGKGKAADAGVVPVRIYVNCSIGDELSPQELAQEQAAAANPPDESSSAASPHRSGHPSAWQRPRPRGFDRLLQTGFTQSEIETLRTQFASIRTEGFAPDAMPSPNTLRDMEDAWIDNNAGGMPSANASAEDDVNGISNVLDAMVRGMMVGFFFPLASLIWLLRSDMWSDKFRIFVGSGVVLSVTVGIVMSLSSVNN
ncbi:hypothetical protein Trco_004525 [Trichoderma cornu-damae]|uniref:DSC E3 ubiquitin ligase complex subunit 3 C-terminal domain-containing protein n=1 Tax=Trichoderma cornu-damae TaxID=654480 RepID=A0A9P8TXL3_9HYPO|nr:hypothetical protein Trco_004525 [Trichoderma cornu-damae]